MPNVTGGAHILSRVPCLCPHRTGHGSIRKEHATAGCHYFAASAEQAPRVDTDATGVAPPILGVTQIAAVAVIKNTGDQRDEREEMLRVHRGHGGRRQRGADRTARSRLRWSGSESESIAGSSASGCRGWPKKA